MEALFDEIPNVNEEAAFVPSNDYKDLPLILRVKHSTARTHCTTGYIVGLYVIGIYLPTIIAALKVGPKKDDHGRRRAAKYLLQLQESIVKDPNYLQIQDKEIFLGCDVGETLNPGNRASDYVYGLYHPGLKLTQNIMYVVKNELKWSLATRKRNGLLMSIKWVVQLHDIGSVEDEDDEDED